MPARRSCVNEEESYICRLHMQSYTENINCTNSYNYDCVCHLNSMTYGLFPSCVSKFNSLHVGETVISGSLSPWHGASSGCG